VEAVVRLAGGVAHDFNNLLTVISGNAEGMLESEGSGAFRTELEQIADAARRAAVLTNQLLAFSRQLVLNPRPTNLAHVLESAWGDLEQALGPGIQVHREVAPASGAVYVDAAQLGKAMGHLVRNAAEAMPTGGEVVITVRDQEVDRELAATRHPMPPGAYVLLEVRDNGPGMDAETLRRAMEPFYTTKGRKHGTGMGLPTVYGIVKQSGGFLWIDSAPGSGTTCQLYFPRLADPTAPARPRTPARGDANGGRGTILLVEDEDLVRQLAARTLARAGYQVVEAPNAHAALVEVRERGLCPSLLLTDVVMPGMDGRELATVLERELPGMPVILMSGFVDPRVPVRHPGGPSRLFLEKPFALDRLRSMVRDAMHAASAL
jgi:CheY-like chemotaxis protein/anti-sigma regulatory factor (Ser/Thr protein kinase)